MAKRRGEVTAATDIQIGGLIRLRRAQLGMSQTALANKLGVAFQQVQKYEKGTNRVAAGRLPPLAAALGVDVGYFYGLDDAAAEGDTAVATDCIALMMTKRGAADLLTCFHAMTAPQRSAFLELGKSIAEANSVIPQKGKRSPSAEPGPGRTVQRDNAWSVERPVLTHAIFTPPDRD